MNEHLWLARAKRVLRPKALSAAPAFMPPVAAAMAAPCLQPETLAPQNGRHDEARHDDAPPPVVQPDDGPMKPDAALAARIDAVATDILDDNRQMRDVAREMATAAAQAKSQFRSAMSRSAEAQETLTALHATRDELEGLSRVIGAAARSADETVRVAIERRSATHGCVSTMVDLALAIQEAAGLIAHIARQTRMLAINASIEAARAGDHGKGFAVVAKEVRNLAQQTGSAADAITGKITEMSDVAEASLAALAGLESSMKDVEVADDEIGGAVREQGIMTEQIGGRLDMLRDVVGLLAKEIREAAQIAANTGMLSDLVLETSDSLEKRLKALREPPPPPASGAAN